MGHLGSIHLALFYLWGFWVVLLHAIVASMICVWGLQFVAMAFGEQYDWPAVLSHLILSTYFLMLFPGQRVWTVRLRGPGRKIYTIVGDPNAEPET